MAKGGWQSVALALVVAGLPVLGHAEGEFEGQTAGQIGGQIEGPPSGSVEETAIHPEIAIDETQREAAPPAMGRVARASFTSEVIAREPQDSITSLGNDNTQIVFFSELQAAQGQTVFHVWELDGTEMARVAFDVAGPRWRVYSTKKLEPSWLGQWTVRVEDASGRELERRSFAYVPAEPAPVAAEVTGPGPELPVTPGSEPEVAPIQQPPASAR